jgi:hypothetical protein
MIINDRDRDRGRGHRETLIDDGVNELGTSYGNSNGNSNGNDDDNSNSPINYDRSNTLTSRHHDERVHHVINDFTSLHLSPKEQEAFNCWDFFIVRLNFLSMIIPLMHGKLTGKGCSENSYIRVSEIGMLCLIISRVLLNVQVDMLIDRRFTLSLNGFRKACWSTLEHGVPAYWYYYYYYYYYYDYYYDYYYYDYYYYDYR